MPKFSTGDVVMYVGHRWAKNLHHIIYEVVYLGKGRFEYSTNRGAWFTSKEFALVRKADTASFAALDKSIDDKDDEENEDV